MEMYGLILEAQRCSDGVALGLAPPNNEGAEQGLAFRSRTHRQETIRREFENLEDPIVVEFINAREDADRIKFFSKFGFLFAPKIIHPASKSRGSDYDFVIATQKELRDFLIKATGPDQVEALQALNSSLERYGPINSQPYFDLAGAAGAPRILLKFSELMHFMVMEVAMIARHGAKLATCEHCGAVFLTGPLTGRRSHAKYCSDRCRVAAMRARNSAKSAS
jgi:hypothetical protein